MTGIELQRARSVFEKLIDVPVDQRSPILAQECGGDRKLQAFVEELLANHDSGLGGFLASPVQLSNGPSAPLDTPPLPPRIGQYEIVRVIGEGGMGVVYEATQDNPRRTVALKVIRAGVASRALLWRFEQEAQVLGRLQHPGIAQIFEASTFKRNGAQQPYFAMELVRGQPLTEYAETHHLGTRQRLELLVKICDAVQHAHQRGVIHRDLKPANIIVDDSSQPKILDFGVARATDSDIQVATQQTDVGQLIGTLPYMSPEQVLGDPQEVDTRCDVYALGVICYELLAGRLPHPVQRKAIPEAVRAIREDEPTRLSSVNRVLRGDIETMVVKALEKDKDRRYVSASDLAADIRHFLQDEPITARPASTFYQLRKFTRRNKVLVGGVAAVLVALLLGLAGTSLGLWRETIATREANAARQAAEDERNRAVAAEQQAEKEAEKADRTSRFFRGMLAAADPAHARGKELTMQDLLDITAQRVDGELDEYPEVEVEVRYTLGTTYQNLGLYEAAERQFAVAVETCRSELGDENELTLQAMNNLGNALIDRDKYAEAEIILREMNSLAVRLLGENHPGSFISLDNLGVAIRSQGRLSEAEQLHRQAVAAARTHGPGQAHGPLNHLALVLKLQDKLEEAEPLYREVLEIRRELFGDDHPSTLTSMNNLGVLLSRRKEYSEAEDFLRKTLDGRRRVLGDDHRATLIAADNLVPVLESQGRLQEAEELNRWAVEGFRRTLGEDNLHTLIAMTNLGSLLQTQGRLPEAASVLTQTVATSKRALSPTHYRTAAAQVRLAECLIALQQYEEAQTQLLECHPILDDSLGPQHGDTQRAIRGLVGLYEAWDKPADAERYRILLLQRETAAEETGT